MSTCHKLAILLFAMMAAIPNTSAAQAVPKKITVSESGRLFVYLPLYYAIEKGFFAKEGLDVTVLTAGRRDLAMKAVLAEEVFASVHDPIEAALARSRGADVKMIAPVVYSSANWLVGDKDITADPKTWRGKTIALWNPPNTQYSIFVEDALKSGWKEVDRTTYQLGDDRDPSHQLKVLFGAFGSELALVTAGRANMTLTLEPAASTLVLKGDKHIIKDYAEIIGPFLLSSINILEKTITNDRTTVQKFMTALDHAYADMYRHPDELEAVALKWFPNNDPNINRSAIKNMLAAKAFPPSTKFIESAFEKNRQYFAAGQPDSPALKITFGEIADTSFSDKAAK